MYFNDEPRACALGFAGVSPLQGSLRTGLISYLSFVVLIIVFIGRCGCLRLLSDLLGGVVVCACCRICCSVWLFAFIVGFIGWCRCLRLLSDLLFGVVVYVYCRICCLVGLFAFIGWCRCLRLLFGFIGWCGWLRLLSDLLGGAGVSAVGTTLLQSPGWNEGKARNATLGKHGQKRIELRRSGTHSERLVCVVAFFRKVPPLWGSINVFLRLTQGLRPGLCRSIALAGLLAD